MDLYLKLSTMFKGKWLALFIITLASCLTLGSQTYCLIWNWENEKKCFQFIFLRTCQALMVPTLSCCLLVFSDLFTTKYKKKISELRRIGYRCCHENSNTSQDTRSVSVAVIEVQHNNFFPTPCCGVTEHVRCSSNYNILTITLSFAQSIDRIHHSPHEDIRGLDSFTCGRGTSLVLGTIGHIHLRHLHHRHHMGDEKE